MKNKTNINNKINTIIKCPNCKTKIDFTQLKEAIKHKIELKIDSILEDI